MGVSVSEQDRGDALPSATVDSKRIIKDAYRKRYPHWGEVQVSDGIEAFNGMLFVVRPENGKGDGEICYFGNSRVQIFGSTEDLVEFLQSKANAPLLERMSNRSVVTAAVFVLLVLGVFTAGFFKDNFNSDVITILGNVLGVAAGFFFGQSFAKDGAK